MQLLVKLAPSNAIMQSVLSSYKDTFDALSYKSMYSLMLMIHLLYGNSKDEIELIRNELPLIEKQKWIYNFFLGGELKWGINAIKKIKDKTIDKEIEEYLNLLLEFIGIIITILIKSTGKLPDDKTENNNFIILDELLKPELLIKNLKDFKELGNDLLFLLSKVLSSHIPSKTLFNKSLIILKPIFVYCNDLYSDYAKSLLVKAILSDSSVVREFAKELIVFVSSYVPGPLFDFLDDLLDAALNNNSSELCETIFSLLDTYSTKPTSVKLNTPNKFKLFKTKLTQPFNSLLNLLKIMNKLGELEEVNNTMNNEERETTAKYIFFEYLFPLNNSKNPLEDYKCKDNNTREAAFNLILTLTKHNCSYTILKDCILLLEQKVTNTVPWNYKPEEQSELHLVGIQNLGAICYINAMIQQFFVLKAFSNRIISMDIKKGIAYELQKIFIYLMNSSRKAINPKSFCSSFKWSCGEPISLHVQKDAHEFLNILFEQLEYELKGTPYNLLLKSIFGGQLCSQVICQNCRNVSNTFEDYYTLSLEIKNQKSIYGSLDQYIANDTVSDYLCNECSMKCNATKRTLLSKLPNVLIVHLQRFSYNFDLLGNEKIHSRLEFPCILDISRYTREYVANDLFLYETEELPKKPKEHYLYDLVGIVIHSGNADSGHYYSYVKTGEESWVEFNDSRIAKFSLSQLEAECFGENIEGNTKTKYSKSAYMLIYEIQVKSPIPVQVEDFNKEEGIAERIVMNWNEREDMDHTIEAKVIYNSNLYTLQQFNIDDIVVPNNLKLEVMNDNINHLFERLIYNKEFVKFTSLLFIDAVFYDEELISRLYISFFVKTFPYVELSDLWYFLQLENKMIKFFNNSSIASRNLLEHFIKTPTKTMDVLIRSSELATRQCLCKTALAALTKIYTEEKPFFNTSNELLTKSFINMCINFINTELATQWMKFNQFFELLNEIAIDSTISLYLIQKNVVEIGVDFMMGDKSPIVKSKLHKNCHFAQQPDFTYLIALISKLSQTVHIKQGEYIDPSKIECKSEDDIAKCLLAFEPIKRHLQDNGDVKQIFYWVMFVCRQSIESNKQVCQLLVQILNKDNLKRSIEFLDLIKELLTSKDPYQMQRIEYLLGYCQPINLSDSSIAEENYVFIVCILEEKKDGLLQLLWKHKEQPFTYQGIKVLMEGMVEDEKVDKYIKAMPAPSNKYKSYISWMVNYIKEQSKTNVLLDELIKKLRKKEERTVTNPYRIGKIIGVKQYKQWTDKAIKLNIEEIEAEIINTNIFKVYCGY